MPKLVLDAEVVRQCRRVARGIELDDRHVMLDVSARIGPGGHFLGARRRASSCARANTELPEAFVRGAYDTWHASGVPEVERATKMVDEILATHEVAPLPDGGEERMRAAVEGAPPPSSARAEEARGAGGGTPPAAPCVSQAIRATVAITTPPIVTAAANASLRRSAP